MKCEVCLKLLEEYIDGELVEHEAAPVSAHLLACAGCANEFEALTTEQEIYARYDRGLEIAPSMWNAIAERTTAAGGTVVSGTRFRLRDWFVASSLGWSLAGAMAVLVAALMIGLVYLLAHRQQPKPDVIADVTKTSGARFNGAGSVIEEPPVKENTVPINSVPTVPVSGPKLPVKVSVKAKAGSPQPAASDRSDVLGTDVTFSAAEEQDTQRHLEQAENLLRSVRNIEVSEDESEIDVSYEKTLSRRLLDENVVLRRDAEMSGKFPTKTLLTDLEPFLIDIANLPDKASADDLRVIKERVQKTEIVADLRSYGN